MLQAFSIIRWFIHSLQAHVSNLYDKSFIVMLMSPSPLVGDLVGETQDFFEVLC